MMEIYHRIPKIGLFNLPNNPQLQIKIVIEELKTNQGTIWTIRPIIKVNINHLENNYISLNNSNNQCIPRE